MKQFILLIFLLMPMCYAQITAAGGQNASERAKKHQDLTKVCTHTQDHGWKSSLDLALNMSSGNSDSGYLTAGLTLDKKRGQNDYFARISYAYGEESGQTSLDELLGTASWKRTGSGGYYTGLRFDYRQDALADIDYRLSGTFLQGYNLYGSDKGWVTPEIGLAYSAQQIGGVEKERFNVYAGIHAEYWLNEKTRFYTSLTVFVPFEESKAYYLWGELGMETLITENISLKIYLQDSYENAPAIGRVHNDLRVIAGLLFKL